MTTRSTARAITAAGLAVVGAVALAGCTHDTAAPSSSGSAAAHASSSPSATPSSSASAKPVGEPVDVPCDTLVPASTFSVYGKTFTLDDAAKPASGSTAATIAAQRGEVCVWKDATDGIAITLGVAKLPADPLTRLKDRLYQDSNSVPTYTVEGYFDTAAGVGRADAFADPYWIDAQSTMFGEPGDAEPIIDSVRLTLVGSAPAATSTPTTSAG